MSDRPIHDEASTVLTEERLRTIRKRINDGIANADDAAYLWDHTEALQAVTARIAGASMRLACLSDEELVKQESWVKSDEAQLVWAGFPMLPDVASAKEAEQP